MTKSTTRRLPPPRSNRRWGEEGGGARGANPPRLLLLLLASLVTCCVIYAVRLHDHLVGVSIAGCAHPHPPSSSSSSSSGGGGGTGVAFSPDPATRHRTSTTTSSSSSSSSASSSSCHEEYDRVASRGRTPGITRRDLRRSEAWIGNRHRLSNAARALSSRTRPIFVVVAGGSISLGHGVAREGARYADRLGGWMNDMYPLRGGNGNGNDGDGDDDDVARHEVINVAAHGADMCSMAKRLNVLYSDLSSKLPKSSRGSPDQIVLEFAVNDYQGQDHLITVDSKKSVFFEGFRDLVLCAEVVVHALLNRYPNAALMFLEMQTAIVTRKTGALLHMGVGESSCCVRSFVRSFVRLFVRSLVRSFVRMIEHKHAGCRRNSFLSFVVHLRRRRRRRPPRKQPYIRLKNPHTLLSLSRVYMHSFLSLPVRSSAALSDSRGLVRRGSLSGFLAAYPRFAGDGRYVVHLP